MQQTMQPEKKKGLFSQKNQPQLDFDSLSQDLSVVGRRLRVLEDHYTNLNRKTQVTEQNMINNNKKFMLEFKTMTSDVNEIRKQMEDLTNTLRQVIEQLKKTAKKEDVKVLEKYVNLWEPVKFMTQDQVEKIISEKLQEKNS